MRRLCRAGLAALLIACSNAPAQEAIPSGLRDWQGWVLRGQEFRQCPFLAARLREDAPIARHRYRCVWPGRLSLSVDARGGHFSQRWQVHLRDWVTLPGNTEHWPRDVRVDGRPAPIVERHGRPGVLLAAGTHEISGRFEWSMRPETLPLADSIALIELSVDGQRVAQPERPEGAVWLGKRRSAEQPAAMDMQVYRLVSDDIPTILTTHVRLNVAGDAREELLARALPEDFVPVRLSGSLPARLEPDGRLRVQVRPGSHTLELSARAPSVANALARPVTGDEQWAVEEVWSFAANDRLRVAGAEGADAIDAVQANVPDAWRQYPAFRMEPGSSLRIVERSRGLASADDNRLSLERDLWLDFDHRGYTAVDQVTGAMLRDWRLDMRAPFILASARQSDDQLLVTEGPGGGAGLELREPALDLVTVARKEGARGAMPATGWDSRFDRVVGKLHLPAGHRLLAAVGADAAPNSWWERWGLWDVFGVMLVVAFVYWTAGRIPAAIAALALVLMYQEAPSHTWLWGNLLAALAVARVAPDGRFRRFARWWRTGSFVLLAFALLPFLASQFRYALYPQLAPGEYASSYSVPGENPYGLASMWHSGPSLLDLLPAGKEAAAAPEPPLPPKIEMDLPSAQLADAIALPPEDLRQEQDLPTRHGIDSFQVVRRHAAGTVLQAGPGTPGWHFASYNYYWTGPVEAADTVRFVYLGPVAMLFWRLIGIAALVVLFLWLAALAFDRKWKWAGLMPRGGGVAGLCGWLVVGAVAILSGGARPARAAEAPAVPGSDILAELEERLIAAPPCVPTCAGISFARVTVDGDRLAVDLQVSALANAAVALPHARDLWQIEDVTVDVRSASTIGREDDGSLWVPLSPGAHQVRLAGRLAAAESIQLAFPERPRVIEARATGWVVTGINESRLVSGSLGLARERTARLTTTGLAAGSEFPAFVRVERTFSLGLDWTIDTRVVRVAPDRAAVSMEIPLIDGESVLTPGVEVRDSRIALVGLAAGEAHTDWHSAVVRTDTLRLEAPVDTPRTEVWNFIVNPQWHVTFEGFPAVLPVQVTSQVWVYRYLPRPGESLRVSVTRPKGVAGGTLAVDAASLEMSVGRRSTTTRLTFTARSTQGGRHVIRLPPDARVTSVMFGKQPQQLRPENGELPISLLPGTHGVKVEWERKEDIGWRTHPPAVDLRAPVGNIRSAVSLPDSRWTLLAWGPGFGPAVTYWGELLIFLVAAWMFGRWSKSPLRFTEWLLLGLGLSTQSWGVFMITGAWLLAMKWRERWTPPEDSVWRFNAVQVLLALLTVSAVAALVFYGIRDGLLATPDMRITRFDYGDEALRWFADRSDGELATPTVISVPMWVYRALFFLWAGWIAFALVGWLRRAFDAWRAGGLWRSE